MPGAAASTVPAAERQGLDHLDRPGKHRHAIARSVAAIATLVIIGAVVAVTLTLPSGNATPPSGNESGVQTAPSAVAELSAEPSAPATSISPTTSPLAACDSYVTESGENWTTAKAGTVTAGQLAAWQEQRAAEFDIGVVSRHRERPVSEELTVCLYWGHVPAPGVAPVDGTSRTPYDASLLVIASDGSGRLQAAGTKQTLTKLPGDASGG